MHHRDLAEDGSGTTICPGQRQRIARSRYLVRRGDRPHAIHWIEKGWAARYKLLRDGRRHITHFYLPGDICDLGWVSGRQVEQPVIALTPIESVCVERSWIERKLARSAGFSRKVAQQSLVDRVAQDEWLVSLGCKTAIEKIAHLFCELSLRLQGNGQASAASAPCPLSQQHLGDFTGMTPVHVCRTLRELRGRDLIELKRGRLRIPDFARLARLCAFEGDYLRSDSGRGATGPKSANDAAGLTFVAIASR